MKKFIVSFLGFILVTLIALVLFRNVVLKTALEQGVTRLTGFETHVASIRLELPGTLHIKNLVIKNPAGFNEKIFADLPEIYVSLVLPEILRGEKTHLTEVRLNLQKVHIEKNKEGVTNLQMLSSVGGAAGGKPQTGEAPKPASSGKPAMPFAIDKLVLTLRNVSYQDQSGFLPGGVLPDTVSVDLNVQDEVINNVTDPKAVVNIIVSKIVNGTPFGSLLGVNPEELLKGAFNNALASGKETFSQQEALLKAKAGSLTAEAKTYTDVKKAEDSLKAALGGTTKELGGIAGSAKSQVSGLFGKLKSTAPQAGDSTEKAQPASPAAAQ